MRKIFFACIISGSILLGDHVVCIHGVLPKPWAMQKMHHGLWDAGFYSHVYSYPSTKHSIEHHGKHLITYLKKLEKKHPEERFHFVAHSMGGLVLRSAISNVEFPGSMRTGKAVLIGTPNKGSKLAHELDQYVLSHVIMGDYAGKQLRKYTKENIVRLGQFPKGYPVLVIAGTKGYNPLLSEVSDGTVLVEETRLETPHEFYMVRARHPYMSGHPQVIAKTIDYLKEDTEWHLKQPILKTIKHPRTK